MQRVNHLRLCKEAAMAGGNSIKEFAGNTSTEIKPEGSTKRNIVTSSDLISQEAILRVLHAGDSVPGFITEEIVGNPILAGKVIKSGNIAELRRKGAYIVDELDGTAAYERGHYEWSVSVGYVSSSLRHTAGAVFAPMIGNGTLFYGSEYAGTFVTDGQKTVRTMVRSNDDMAEAYVIVGVDTLISSRYPVHFRTVGRLAERVRAVNVIHSCALGLGMLGAGRVDAVIQPPQYPWDFAAGKAVVENAGGTMRFYEMDGKGRITKVLRRLELKHYDYSNKSVGFVAGNENITAQIMDVLLEAQKH